jgi:hypothetical protein
MEKSISREEVLQTISKMEIVEHLSKGVLEEFCKVLKIGEGSSDPRVLSAHLQHKIVDIFDQEGYVFYHTVKPTRIIFSSPSSEFLDHNSVNSLSPFSDEFGDNTIFKAAAITLHSSTVK